MPPGLRKSGMPDSVLTPAPVKTAARSLAASIFLSSSILLWSFTVFSRQFGSSSRVRSPAREQNIRAVKLPKPYCRRVTRRALFLLLLHFETRRGAHGGTPLQVYRSYGD